MKGAILLATDGTAPNLAAPPRWVVAGPRLLAAGWRPGEGVAVFLATRPEPTEDEAAALAGAAGAIAGLWLMRCVGIADLEQAGAGLAVVEARAGLPEGTLHLVASIGTAAGVLALPGLGAGRPRLAGIAFNEAALRLELGIPPGAPSPAPSQQARSLVVLAAAAAGVPAIDAVTEGGSARAVEAAARLARQDGFAAKLAAEPAQVAPITRAFA